MVGVRFRFQNNDVVDFYHKPLTLQVVFLLLDWIITGLTSEAIKS
ncbi:hypothetical protein [Paenibacillus woosongensis]|nr:hypothetical protein [Paenibacillus woosongensis]